VSANSLFSNFDSVNIQHVPRIENQLANDLAQVASGYKVYKEKLRELPQDTKFLRKSCEN